MNFWRRQPLRCTKEKTLVLSHSPTGTRPPLLQRSKFKIPKRDVVTVVEGDLLVHGDPTLFTVMLRNLLDNAWKYSSKRSRAHIEVRGTRVADQLVLTVHDDGAGFDTALAGRLFSPFHRLHSATEFPGDGIGLATVRRVVHRHGGRVSAEGSPDGGATFTVHLPIAGSSS